GFRFRRQHILGGYIADFFCHEANLVIEVDGEIHLSQKEYDAARDRVMREMGATILRIPNACVLNDIEEAKRRIREYLSVPPSGVRGNEASRGDNSPAHAGRA
ncbi:MAG TPA: endonuclease domain-containing protein, partial [Fibrobacteria bacterium]|nr:endonuclease domain-containing protein [Fibrobacteria bacterium]